MIGWVVGAIFRLARIWVRASLTTLKEWKGEMTGSGRLPCLCVLQLGVPPEARYVVVHLSAARERTGKRLRDRPFVATAAEITLAKFIHSLCQVRFR